MRRGTGTERSWSFGLTSARGLALACKTAGMAVLGVDACRGGWAGILLHDDGTVTGLLDASLAGLASAAQTEAELVAIGVDMPIGLPDRGRRLADVLARAVLGPRRASVFLTPVREALLLDDYAGASRRNRELAGEGMSRQVYALRPRLLEADAWARTSPVPVVEVHPEVSFTTLAGGHLTTAKKTWAGATVRRRLLGEAGIRIPDDLGRLGDVAAVDDVLDAAAAAWSARRYAEGIARRYPDPPQVFSDGYRATIYA
jgi:predicted RNase H-like nuclease